MELKTDGMLKIMFAYHGKGIKEGETIMYLNGPVKGSGEDIAELFKLITMSVAKMKGKIKVNIHE